MPDQQELRERLEQVFADPLARLPASLVPAFLEFQRKHYKRYLYKVNLLGLAAYLIFGFADQLIIPDQSSLSWMVRIAFVSIMGLLTLLVFKKSKSIALMDMWMPMTSALAAALWFWMLSQSEGHHVNHYQYASLIFILLGNLSVQVSFMPALVFSGLISVVLGVGVYTVSSGDRFELLLFTLAYYPVLFFSLFISWRTTIDRRLAFVRATLNESTKRALETVNKTLDQLAHSDAVTGLDNRRQFERMVRHELARHERSPNPACLLLFDIDHFKNVNDAYGHDAGDLVLQTLAGVARLQLRQQDVLARYGGDEFAILLANTSGDNGWLVAERLRQRVSEQPVEVLPGVTIQFSISVGMSTLDAGRTNLEDLVSAADLALYEAKRQGRNRVVLESEDPSTVVIRASSARSC